MNGETSTAAPAAAAFDISAYELADTGVLTLKNKAGTDDLLGIDGQPVKVELYSPGSEAGVKAMHKTSRAAQMRLMRTLRGEIQQDDAQKADQEQAEKLAAFTKSISANFPVSPLAVYQNPKLLYINRQVEKFIAETGNF